MRNFGRIQAWRQTNYGKVQNRKTQQIKNEVSIKSQIRWKDMGGCVILKQTQGAGGHVRLYLKNAPRVWNGAEHAGFYKYSRQR